MSGQESSGRWLPISEVRVEQLVAQCLGPLQDKIKDKLGLLELRAALLLKIPGRAGNAEANLRCDLCLYEALLITHLSAQSGIGEPSTRPRSGHATAHYS